VHLLYRTLRNWWDVIEVRHKILLVANQQFSGILYDNLGLILVGFTFFPSILNVILCDLWHSHALWWSLMEFAHVCLWCCAAHTFTTVCEVL